MDIKTKFPSYKLVKSGFETIADDYTAIFIAAGVRDETDLARAMVKRFPHLTYETALQAVEAITNYSADLISENAIRINHGNYAFAPAISGSVRYADSELTEENRVYVDVICSGRMVEVLQDMRLERAEEGANFIFDKVYDLTENKFGVATAGGQAKLRGDRMSFEGEDEGLTVIDSSGESFEVSEIEDVGHGSALVFTVPATAAKGKAVFALRSRGMLTPDARVELIKRTAEILPAAIPPGPRIVLASINGDEEAVETREATSLIPDEGSTFDAWFDTANGDPTLAAVADDYVDWWFEKDGVRHEGKMTLANGGLYNKGDDELMMYMPADEAANLEVNDIVHYHAVLHGGVSGTQPQVFDFTSKVVTE